MTAKLFCNNQSSNRCASAVACASALVRPILDTAILLVVSICVLCLRVITLHT